MNLTIHAITYFNIGPFQKLLTLNLLHQTCLIKSPIGSGKSFLFFDGPIFALYKYSSRNMLNVMSKQGYIKILISVDDDLYLITRSITHAKSKDSVTSRLYKIENSQSSSLSSSSLQLEASSSSQVLLPDIDIQDHLQDQGEILQEIIFKSDTELQNTISSMLPPREVLMNTQFLLQDSDNLFAMQASQRITVFKNIFGLLSIDDAKDIIADRKRELTTKLKVMSDNSHVNNKLQQCIKQAREIYSTLKKQTLFPTLHTVYQQRISDMELIDSDKLSVANIGLNAVDDQLLEQQTKILMESKHLSQQQLIRFQEQQQLLAQEQQLLKDLTQKISNKKGELQTLQGQIVSLDENKREALLAQKTTCQASKDSIIASIDRDLLLDYYQTRRAEQGMEEGSSMVTKGDIHALAQWIQSMIQLGKTLKQQTDLLEQSYQQGVKHQHETREQSLKQLQQEHIHLSQLQQSYTQQHQDLSDQITLMSKDLHQAKRFPCSRINADCPFIEQIAGATIEKFHKQQTMLEKQLADMEIAFNKQHIAPNIARVMTEMQQLTKLIKQGATDTTQPTQDLHPQLQQKEALTKTIDQIKNILQNIDHAHLSSEHQQFKSEEHKLTDIDRQLQSFETHIKQQQTTQQHIMVIQTQLHSLEQQLDQQQQRILQQEKTKGDQQESQLHEKRLALTELEQDRKILSQTRQQIKTLMIEYKEKDRQIQQLKIEEKRMINLYTIFSKELMYVVLEETLPTLFDIINAYLAQVVDYSVFFELTRGGSDKLELEVFIQDDKGIRPIKSLSGGQKVILKLVRIMAVASYVRTGSLFLDETINNLDQETILKVAQMLQDFVKGHDIKLYVVTHSSHIQSMAMRDKVIELE